MKLYYLLATAVLIASTSAYHVQNRKSETFSLNVTPVGAGSQEECKTCIAFAGQTINDLLNFVLQEEIDVCGDICQILEDKTGKKALGVICNILCDAVGIKEFIDVIQKADLDPIYFCELVPACPVNDNGDASFTSVDVTPTKGPQGEFDVSFEYLSKNGTGTGMLAISVDTVDGIPLGDDFLNFAQPAGTYDGTIKLNAKEDPDCDPTQGPCETWEPGNYTIHLSICNGECGSNHPHSAIYDTKTTMFEITN